MIVSAVEVFPKECLGVLLGHKTQHTVIVEQAFCYQTAERTGTSVEVEEKREMCCRDMLRKLTSLESVGDFHSHTDTQIGTKLTAEDRKEENMKVGDIEVIIAVSKKKRSVRWGYNRKKLFGVFGDFRFDIAAYTCYNSKHQTRKFQRIELLCPFALGIGSK